MRKALVYLLIALTLVGWLANIYALTESVNETLTLGVVIRLIGVFLYPLGALIGLTL